MMAREGIEPSVFTAWVPDLQSGAVAAGPPRHMPSRGFEPRTPRPSSACLYQLGYDGATEGAGIEPAHHSRGGLGLANRPHCHSGNLPCAALDSNQHWPALKAGASAIGLPARCPARDSNPQPLGSEPSASANWATRADARHRSRTCTRRVLSPLPLPLGYARVAMSWNVVLRKGRGSNSQGSYARRFSGPLPSPAVGLPFQSVNNWKVGMTVTTTSPAWRESNAGAP